MIRRGQGGFKKRPGISLTPRFIGVCQCQKAFSTVLTVSPELQRGTAILESTLTTGHRSTERGGPGSELITPNPKLKLLDQVREVMRLKHYFGRNFRSPFSPFWSFHAFEFVLAALSRRRSGSNFGFRISGFPARPGLIDIKGFNG